MKNGNDWFIVYCSVGKAVKKRKPFAWKKAGIVPEKSG